MRRLTGTVQPYPWGSATLLPHFLGTEPTGDPQAELWLGAHPQAPSRIDDTSLDAAIAADPAAWVGAEPVRRYGARLPFLMKVLAAAQPLSLQAHPDRAQAEAGFAREDAAGMARTAPERTYSDDWPKPEALCALDSFDALCGFRDPQESCALFERLGVPGAVDLVRPLQHGGADQLAEVFERLLRMRDASELVTAVRQAAQPETDRPGPFGDFARTAVEVSAHYPTDAGVLAALIMNRVRLQRHEAIYLPPGNLHAYLSGIGVEIMANSDNVLRGGLTGKHIDIDELLGLLDFTPGFAGTVPVSQTAPGVISYQTGAPEFTLWRLDVDGTVDVPGTGQGRIALVTEGEVAFQTTPDAAGAAATGSSRQQRTAEARSLSGPQNMDLTRGESCYLLPADRTRITGGGIAFISSTGTPPAVGDTSEPVGVA